MRAFLFPLSHPELGKIAIEGAVFHIGRHEVPFANNKNDIGRTLSRRHARLFEEQGVFYVADMGSLNGTTVNGNTVKGEPMRLEPGDEICFANKLTFTFERENVPETRLPETTASVRLTLIPVLEQNQLNSIVVTRFPFLIGKTDSVFAEDKNLSVQLLRYVSRRHALIFAKGTDLYIEDLGSKNGTFVGDKRLDEHAKLLGDGDKICFGSREHLAYSVRIEKEPTSDVVNHAQVKLEQTETGDTGGSVQPSGSGKTTYVATATSFLDIFCLEEHAQKPSEKPSLLPNEQDHQGKDGRPAAHHVATAHKAVRVWIKAKAFFKELSGAFREEDGAHSKPVWMIIGIVLVVALVPLGLYLYGGPQRDIQTTLSEGQYATAADLADEHLRDNPNDASIALLGTEALMKHIVPLWIVKLTDDDFHAATMLLDDASQLTEFNQDGKRMLEVLHWISDLEAFIQDRGGSNAPIKLFNHEMRIETLLERWNKDSIGHQELMHRILTYVPSFADVHSRSFSYLRALRGEKSLYLKAIEDLKQEIVNKLDAGQIKALSAKIDTFAKRYRRIQGIDVLRSDLNQYVAIENVMKDGRLEEVNKLLAETEFKTPVFHKWVQEAAATRLPSPEIASQYQKATGAWRAGDVDKALRIMSALQASDWSDIATRKLSRYRQIVNNYRSLQNIQDEQGYGKQLLLFYRSLDATEDQYFQGLLHEAYEQHKSTRLSKAKKAWKRAENEWAKYMDKGGIDSTERVEPEISDSFREKADLLSKAYTYTKQANSIYELLAMEPPPNEQNLRREIMAEIRRQRQWLEDLRLVIKVKLLKDKLNILPVL